MNKRPLLIGDLKLDPPFVLAPLAGITDRSMRSLCSQAGASLTYTEMVSAKGLWYGDRKTGELLRTWMDAERVGSGSAGGCMPVEGPVGFQLFGSEPLILEYAVRALADPEHAAELDREMAGVTRAPLGARTVKGLRAPALFDLNAGCPVPKIVRNGEGSALLRDPDLFYECVAAMVRGAHKAAEERSAVTSVAGGAASNAQFSGGGELGGSVKTRYGSQGASRGEIPQGAIPVTVKIRKGFERDDDCAVEIAKAAEAAGAAAITVHGRTRQQFYEGKADWDVIAAVKAAVRIPVIGNGDVMSGADAIRMMEQTGCDGVMIARGALGNPWIFAQARALWEGASLADLQVNAGTAVYLNASASAEASTSAGAPTNAGAPTIAGTPTSAGTSTNAGAPTSAGTPLRSEAAAPAFPPFPSNEQRIKMLLRHIDMVCADKGEHIAVREMRKHVGWYLKGMRGAAQIRRQINTAANVGEMKQILSELIP